MSTNLAAQESMNFDMPPHFYEDYEYLCEELKILFDDIKDRHIHPTLDSVTEHFIQLYESFSSEKQVFDSLNACKYSNDPIYEHSINVAILSRMLGDLNYMYSDDLNALTQAALLHDIGKLLVDPDILYKTEKLTTHEFNLIKKHTKLGYQLLNDQFTDYRIPAVALMHHERCDGSG